MLIALAVTIALFWISLILRFGSTPAEDAFILFRYADHLSSGLGITWNVGSGPVEGATDFLWLILVALASKVFDSPILAAHVLGTAFAAGTVLLLIAIARRQFGLSGAGSLLPVCAYLATPALIHVANGFSPPMFTFLLVLAVFFYAQTHSTGDQTRSIGGMSLTMLLIGLTRPEGNIFNFALLAAYLASRRGQPRVDLAAAGKWILLLYVVPGLIYYLWRFSYFGHALPLPFYVKAASDGTEFTTISGNIAQLIYHAGIPIVASIWALFVRSTKQHAEGILRWSAVPAFALLLTYLPFHQSQNVVYRFQYPALTLLIALSAFAFALKFEGLGRLERLTHGSTLFLAVVWMTLTSVPIPEQPDDTIVLGSRLANVPHGDETLATTEAGRLPFYSKWRTLDTYGLNDPIIATRGLTYARWMDFAPTLVVIHPTYAWKVREMPLPPNDDGNRRSALHHMRRRGSYELIAVVQRFTRKGRRRTDDFNLYFLWRGSPHYEDLRVAISQAPRIRYAQARLPVERYLRSDQTYE